MERYLDKTSSHTAIVIFIISDGNDFLCGFRIYTSENGRYFPKNKITSAVFALKTLKLSISVTSLPAYSSFKYEGSAFSAFQTPKEISKI